MVEHGSQSILCETTSPVLEQLDEMAPGNLRPCESADSLSELLEHVRREQAFDFASYDASVVAERVARRMQARALHDIRDYVRVAEASAEERRALFRDLLIGKTEFFRDPECFDALRERVLPELLRGARGRPLRIWVAGCSSGEEVYSILMALMECAPLGPKPDAQLFATDLDEWSLSRARRGTFPRSIESQVSPRRLARFFTREGDRYRIVSSLRNMACFARHELGRAPPYARIDLVSCRNLLIYLNPQARHNSLQALHYALRPTGRLLLGSSETIARGADLFTLVDGPARLYAKKAQASRRARSAAPEEPARTRQAHHASWAEPTPFSVSTDSAPVAADLQVLRADLHRTMRELAINREELRIRSTRLQNTRSDLALALGRSDATLTVSATDERFEIVTCAPSARRVFGLSARSTEVDLRALGERYGIAVLDERVRHTARYRDPATFSVATPGGLRHLCITPCRHTMAVLVALRFPDPQNQAFGCNALPKGGVP